MDAQKTGALIAQARREKGMTQKELSQILHVSAQAVSKWERGLNFPDVALLEPLGEYLGLTVSELLAGQRGEEPKEELLRDSLKLVLAQVGKRLRRWRRAFLACVALLAAAAVAVGFWLVKTRTAILPQGNTVVVLRELTERERMIAGTARTDNVYLYDLTAADGTSRCQVKMELWTEEGLERTWYLAELMDGEMSRHQQLAFSYAFQTAVSGMEVGVTLASQTDEDFQGTWRTTLRDVPDREWGYTMDLLEGRCTLDSEYGAVLACWSIPTQRLVTQGPSGSMRVDYVPPEWTGLVEEPQVEAGAYVLLLRLQIQ